MVSLVVHQWVVAAGLSLSGRIAAFRALLPVLLPSKWGQVEIVVRPQENIDAASARRVRVQDLFALAQEHTQSRFLALLVATTEILVEVPALARPPRHA